MTNYLRTLLLNLPAPESYALFEEYIDPSFKPLQLPEYLQTVYNAFYGDNPTRDFANYRVKQLLIILHSSYLSDRIYSYDRRVTYFPFERAVNTLIDDHPLDLVMQYIDSMPITELQDLFLETDLVLYFNSRLYNDRICSVILAFVHRLEELRNASA